MRDGPKDHILAMRTEWCSFPQGYDMSGKDLTTDALKTLTCVLASKVWNRNHTEVEIAGGIWGQDADPRWIRSVANGRRGFRTGEPEGRPASRVRQHI